MEDRNALREVLGEALVALQRAVRALEGGGREAGEDLPLRGGAGLDRPGLGGAGGALGGAGGALGGIDLERIVAARRRGGLGGREGLAGLNIACDEGC